MTYKIETFDTSIPQPPPPPTAPDLMFTDFGPSGFTVKNIGTAASGAFNVQIISTAPQTFNIPVGSLAPGASTTLPFTFTCLGYAGTVDSAGQVIESNESNNGANYAPSIC